MSKKISVMSSHKHKYVPSFCCCSAGKFVLLEITFKHGGTLDAQ